MTRLSGAAFGLEGGCCPHGRRRWLVQRAGAGKGGCQGRHFGIALPAAERVAGEIRKRAVKPSPWL